MLDKTIPYKNIIMMLPGSQVAAAARPRLPEGYAFRLYVPGDEQHWARIETSVLEFDTEAAALAYYTRIFLPYGELLQQRCVFVTDPDGLPVATATAWADEAPAVGRQAILHWVSVVPEQQGLGLGKAVVQRALQIFSELEPGADIYLHTQTWSHPAIRLYRRLGFSMRKTAGTILPDGETGGRRVPPNEFCAAMEVLRGVLDEKTFADLLESAR